MSKVTRRNLQELEDAFIKVTFEPDSPTATNFQEAPGAPIEDPFYEPWFERGSAKFSDPNSFGAVSLRKIYPKHTVTPFYGNLMGYPHILIEPVSPPDVVSSLAFVPFARPMGEMTGTLMNVVRFGLFRVAWDKYDYLLYVARYPAGFGENVVQYLMHEGPEEPNRALLLASGIWDYALHEEIYVYNQGWWQKDHSLWLEVQKANWKDVILKEEFKKALQKDVNGFFNSEALYKSLAIPWKRGLIMYGPPGNGKTISMKAIMKETDARGYSPLYVRSFQNWAGDEAGMAAVFERARQMAPCVLVLEDLDSLINDRNRSFFLNELDGLEDNDGLLIIGTTNHFDKLDPALSGRPSRFDRKYLFDDPDKDERALYCKYWQGKLKSNHDIEFPDSLIDEIATATEKFSFAYLKEAFVSTLVLLAGKEKDDTSDFKTLLKGQIKSLRDQLDHTPGQVTASIAERSTQLPPRNPANFGPRDRASMNRFAQNGRFWNTSFRTTQSNAMPGGLSDGSQLDPLSGQNSGEGSSRRDVRSMAMSAAALGRSFIV